MNPEKRECPGVGTEAFEDSAGHRSIESVAPEAVIDGVFVAVVETGSGHYRRRVYLTLSAAQSAVSRARSAGIAARVILAELRSLGVVK